MENKPPLGIMPKEAWEQVRIQELSRAINRYTEACFPVPLKWIDELRELTERQGERLWTVSKKD